jgi:hypothetical protein
MRSIRRLISFGLRGRVIWVIAIAGLTAACNVGPGDQPAASVLKLDQQQLWGISWADGKQLIVVYTPGENIASRLAAVTLDGTSSPIAAPETPDCHLIAIADPERVSSGSMIVNQECVNDPPAPLFQTTLMRFEQATGQYTPVASLGDMKGPPGQIAPSPDGSRQLVAVGTLCGVIVEATIDGPRPLSIVVSGDGKRFRLDDIAPLSPDCVARGRADQPTWAPAGDEIAFFAAPAAIGLEGPARAAVPANLYVSAPDGSNQAKLLVPGVTIPRGLHYSPDGRYLAFGGEIGGKVATWVLDRTTGKVRQIHDHRLDWLAWSPDGTQIAGIQKAVDEPPFPKEIVIVPFTPTN